MTERYEYTDEEWVWWEKNVFQTGFGVENMRKMLSDEKTSKSYISYKKRKAKQNDNT